MDDHVAFIAQALTRDDGGSGPSLKTIAIIAHVVLAVVGLAFGQGKAAAAEAAGPKVLDDKEVADRLKQLRGAAGTVLFIGALVTGRCVYDYLRKHSSAVAYSNAWHAGTTMLLPGMVYWVLIRTGGGLSSNRVLWVLRIMSGVHDAFAGLTIALYVVVWEKGLLFWAVMTAFLALILLGICVTSGAVINHRRAAALGAAGHDRAAG
jgi:hypothetical protein